MVEEFGKPFVNNTTTLLFTPYEGITLLRIAISACARRLLEITVKIGQGRSPLSPPRLCLLPFNQKEEQETVNAYITKMLFAAIDFDPLFANTSKLANLTGQISDDELPSISLLP